MATYTGAEKFIRTVSYELDTTSASDQPVFTVAANSRAEVNLNFLTSPAAAFDVEIDSGAVVYSVVQISSSTVTRDVLGILHLGPGDIIRLVNFTSPGQVKEAHIVINEYQLQ